MLTEFFPSLKQTTICAVATPAGGAIGMLRISGPEAIQITSKLFQPAGKCTLEQKTGGSLTFGRLIDPENNEILDEVVVSLYRAPHSYTGEDCTEITCHGSHYILNRALQLLIAEGCQMAKPGEYTQRAFMNGKMDLSQAEAVADLIASTTAANHRMAMKQMKGQFSNELRTLRDKLLHITSLLELELDFSDHEELEFADRTELLDLAQTIKLRIAKLQNSFKLGNALKQGIPVAIVGETNAGKSTLLNALVGEQRALVSDIHGTTRDTVEETIVVGDTLIRFIDTAGIRNTNDRVEQMGIERTYLKMQEADIILWIIDATQARKQYEQLKQQMAESGKPILLILNKTDLLNPCQLDELRQHFAQIQTQDICHTFSEPNDTSCRQESNKSLEANETSCRQKSLVPTLLCAHHEADIDLLRTLLSERLHHLQSQFASPTDIIVSNARHYEALTQALHAIERVIEALQINLSGELVSQDLRECIHHLSDIVGEVSTDAVLQNIFHKFCIGK